MMVSDPSLGELRHHAVVETLDVDVVAAHVADRVASGENFANISDEGGCDVPTCFKRRRSLDRKSTQ